MSEERGPFYPEIIGPFQPEHYVTIADYKVPYITVRPCENGDVDVCLDRRFGVGPVSRDEFNRWIGFLANAMAVSAGFSSHGEHCNPINVHKHRVGSLGSMPPNLTVIDGGKEVDPS